MGNVYPVTCYNYCGHTQHQQQRQNIQIDAAHSQPVKLRKVVFVSYSQCIYEIVYCKVRSQLSEFPPKSRFHNVHLKKDKICCPGFVFIIKRQWRWHLSSVGLLLFNTPLLHHLGFESQRNHFTNAKRLDR